MPYSQQERLIALTTPLGEDVLLLAGFSGHEAVSRLFNFHLDLLSEQGPIDFAEIIGKNVTITVTQSDNTPRYFNGMVSQFAQSGSDVRFTRYQMQVVPWTWMLTRYADCKIFHNKKVGDIMEQVFKDRGFQDYKLSLNGGYSPIEYCVQYRETDFNFISRLMEQNGIFYFFQHEMGKHTMVIADSPSAHEPCPGQETAGYNLVSGGIDEADVINSWNLEQELRSGKYTLTDYNFKTPSANLDSHRTQRYRCWEAIATSRSSTFPGNTLPAETERHLRRFACRKRRPVTWSPTARVSAAPSPAVTSSTSRTTIKTQ